MSRAANRIEKIADYAAAEKFFEKTKHIRGRSEQDKPLGDRRHIDRFTISRAYRSEGVVYICTLYRTPVVTFMPDGEVQVRVHSYTTPSTHDFIRGVLTSVSASTHEGQTALSVANGKFIVPRDGYVGLRRSDKGYYEAIDQKPQTKIKINRTGTAAVRRKYADFISYMDGTLAIRKHEGVVHITYGEIGDVLDTTKIDGVVRLDASKYETNWVKKSRNTGMQNLLGMITDKSEDQHKWFYKAFLTLVMAKSVNQNYSSSIRITGNENRKVLHSAAVLKGHLLDSLYRWHSGWTLTRVTLPLGELGSTKYEHWLRGADEELA